MHESQAFRFESGPFRQDASTLVCLCVGFVVLYLDLAEKMWKAVCVSVNGRTEHSNKRFSPASSTPGRKPREDPGSVYRPRLMESYAKMPLRFEANRGQTDCRIKYLSRGRAYSLFLTSDEAVLVLDKPPAVSHHLLATRNMKLESRNSALGLPASSLGPLLPTVAALSPAPTTPVGTPALQSVPAPGVLGMKLMGASQDTKVQGLDELPGKSNY